MPRQLFLEVVIALEAAAETIDGLAGLADPESNGVDCSSQRPHLLLPHELLLLEIKAVIFAGMARDRDWFLAAVVKH